MIPIYLVEDDTPVREALTRLLEGEGLEVRGYATGEAFLADCDEGTSGCVLLDLRLPGMSGLEVQQALRARGLRLPVVFLTGHGDISATVRALKAGAQDFLEKPVNADTLLAVVNNCLTLEEQRAHERYAAQAAQQAVARLTPREREIMNLVLAGHPSKEIGRRLGISHRTVELHRSRLLQKTGARNLLELARIAGMTGALPTGGETPED